MKGGFMFSIISSALFGIRAIPVSVEADTASGLPKFTIVGLPDVSVRESRDRIRSAMKNSRFVFPRGKVTINLAPAHLRKQGACYDLPIAVAILSKEGQIKQSDVHKAVFVGELGLHGEVRGVQGVLATALMAQQLGHPFLFVPKQNVHEAALVSGLTIFGVESLRELVDHFIGTHLIEPSQPTQIQFKKDDELCFSMIRGNASAKRALEIAAAGGHHVLLHGPPGTGKTLLSRTFSSILPPLSTEELLEVATISSVAGVSVSQDVSSYRPLRAPHHSASAISLVGGGKYPRPGEITLAHRGVLFLDELPEFSTHVLEHLRQPLEDGVITVARAQETMTFPSRFQLIATMNPCPCGFFESPNQACSCSIGAVDRYQKKISGPLLDRFDLFVPVPNLTTHELAEEPTETSQRIRSRVVCVRERQKNRYESQPFKTNTELTNKNIDQFCPLTHAATDLLAHAFSKGMLSMRGFARVKKIARTIADLAQCDLIDESHVAEALQYRQQLRNSSPNIQSNQ